MFKCVQNNIKILLASVDMVMTKYNNLLMAYPLGGYFNLSWASYAVKIYYYVRMSVIHSRVWVM